MSNLLALLSYNADNFQQFPIILARFGSKHKNAIKLISSLIKLISSFIKLS